MSSYRIKGPKLLGPGNHSSFLSCIDRIVSNAFILAVSPGFVKKNLTFRGKECKMYVKVGGQRQISALICKFYGESANIMKNGWKNFVQENSLKFGDVCVFELESCGSNLFNVVIYRSASEVEYPLRAGTNDQTEDVSVEILENSSPENQGSRGKRPQPDMEGLQDDISVEILNNIFPLAKPRMRSKDDFVSYQRANAFRRFQLVL